MKKKEKIQFIIETLNHYFPETPIPLSHHDPYTLLIAVLLSAQCTDERVNQVTPKLFALAQTPLAMSKLTEEEIYEAIKSCGLAKTKAKAIRNLSLTLLEKFEGNVPSNLKDLESLQGVGHKTASVVLIQAFGIPAFPVDTHIHRLAQRFGLSNGKNVEQTEKDLMLAFPKELWAKIHLQLIFFGRKFCPARGHDPSICPICCKM